MTIWRALALTGSLLLASSAVANADDTGLGYMHDIVKSGGHDCFASHAHSGTGDGATKQAALQAALKAWWEYTAGEYGSDWAHWSRSASKTVSYAKADKGWTATVESRPCK
jgi:uncharacterized low-complexity protein